MRNTIFESNIEGLELLQRGKVRDIYAIDNEKLLIVASDRISAFDVVLPDPIPGKGAVLTELANFWFEKMQGTIANHLTGDSAEQYVGPEEAANLGARASVVKRLKPLPVEAIARGYVIGSGWKDYQSSGAICGIKLPDGLAQAAKLPEPIYTPSTKAEIGAHDENIDFQTTVDLLGRELAERVRAACLDVYSRAAQFALDRGIIIADTKFEFAIDDDGVLVLIDEVLTPDSSRFWPADEYRTGISPPSFDKQFVRDYLETLDWNKTPPAPSLPREIIEKTAEKYREAQRLLVS